MKHKTTLADTSEVERIITTRTIDNILGLTIEDSFIADMSFPNRRSSHCHSFSSIPINKLTFDMLFIIIANYDRDRKKSKPEHYLQAGHNESDITFLLDELAAAGILILSKNKVQIAKNQPGLASTDLSKLSTTIKKSEYLSSHPEMKNLSNLAFEMWEKHFMEQAQQQFNNIGGGFKTPVF